MHHSDRGTPHAFDRYSECPLTRSGQLGRGSRVMLHTAAASTIGLYKTEHQRRA